jgi:small GTP-binding protein
MLCGEKHKVVLIGESMVGKTSILHRLTKGAFLKSYISTVGTGCGTWISDSDVQLQIWDTAGQERYRALGGIFYQNAEAAIVVFDQNDEAPMRNVDYWVKQFQGVAGVTPYIVLAANKSDTITESSDIVLSIRDWAEKMGYGFIETSAKTGKGVVELFKMVAMEIEARRTLKTKFRVTGNNYGKSLENLKMVEKISNCC